MDTKKASIKEFFALKEFVIPNYQRGYKWGVPDKEKGSSAEWMFESLKTAYETNSEEEYFIQGVTIYEDESDSKYYLIDGQQRTITFYLLLACLGYNREYFPEIHYSSRKDSDDFLREIKNENSDLEALAKKRSDDKQDIHFFRSVIQSFQEKIGKSKLDIEKMRNFILEKVNLFVISIAPEQAVKVFSMMNGSKAIMKDEELIKALILSKASRQNHRSEKSNKKTDEEKRTDEWETNNLRSLYSREWDKWLHWWNRIEVKEFFGTGNRPLWLLLEYFYKTEVKDSNSGFNFKSFKEKLIDAEGSNVKMLVKRLRKLQKKFEDFFNIPKKYNLLGMILKTGDKENALLYFLSDGEQKVDLEEYAKWCLVGASHKEIISNDKSNKDKKDEKARSTYEILADPFVYSMADNRKKMAFRQLLRRNVLLDQSLERKFDFSIWRKKSLEHIYPKSWENEEGKKLNFINNDQYSVHCIGNLVLLYGDDNSSFGKLDFDSKKSKFFSQFYSEDKDFKEKDQENIIKSSTLLHTISVFSNKEWGENQIMKNKESFLKELREYYKIGDVYDYK